MQTLLSHPHTAVYADSSSSSSCDTDGSGSSSSDIPFALQWAFALVRSRAFAAGNDLFAFVPFLDMVRVFNYSISSLQCVHASVACCTVISLLRCDSEYKVPRVFMCCSNTALPPLTHLAHNRM
jgi:hypothetical protein